jgi:hypothetical protein
MGGVIVIDGIYYALALAGAGALLAWLLGPWYGSLLWLLAAFCLYFFRNPDRPIPTGPVAVSPADGKVVHELHRDHVLEGFVFDDPQPGLFDGEPRQVLRQPVEIGNAILSQARRRLCHGHLPGIPDSLVLNDGR